MNLKITHLPKYTNLATHPLNHISADSAYILYSHKLI